jgi:putative SOS response-associated peptidase YedK
MCERNEIVARMCGRFTLTRQDRRELAALLGVDEKDLRDYQPHYDIAPLQDHFVIGSKFENLHLIPARWDLVNRFKRATALSVPEVIYTHGQPVSFASNSTSSCANVFGSSPCIECGVRGNDR